MASVNKVILIGRLTRDPEKRSTPGGMIVVEMGLAMNNKYKAKDGSQREEVTFVGVTVWGKTGELCAEYLRKGSSCYVEGRLKLDEWEKDGQKRSKLTVVAEAVQFLDQRKGEASEPHGEARRPSSVPGKPVAQAELQVDIGPDDDSSIPF
jgi:single-strand DNA-binding protein